eukprot:gene12356-14110_t
MKPQTTKFLGTASSAVLACALGLFSTSALAQTQAVDEQAASRNAGVLDRARPDFDAVGIRAGSFLILPKATTTVDVSDNIYASTTNAVSDTGGVFQPEVTIRSDWSRNLLEMYARAAFSTYASHGSENATEAEIRGSGRYDIQEGWNLNGGLGYAYLAEPRSISPSRAPRPGDPGDRRDTAGGVVPPERSDHPAQPEVPSRRGPASGTAGGNRHPRRSHPDQPPAQPVFGAVVKACGS